MLALFRKFVFCHKRCVNNRYQRPTVLFGRAIAVVLTVSLTTKCVPSFMDSFFQSMIVLTGYPRGTIKSSSSHVSPISPKSPSFKRRRLVDVGVNTSLPGCLNGRSPDLPSNPITWSVEEVIQYVRSTDCGHYAVMFKEEVTTGYMIPSQSNALSSYLEIKVVTGNNSLFCMLLEQHQNKCFVCG